MEQQGIQQARANLGDIVAAALYRGEMTIITRYGAEAAAVIPPNLAVVIERAGGPSVALDLLFRKLRADRDARNP